MVKGNSFKALIIIMLGLVFVSSAFSISVNTDQGEVIPSYNDASFNGYVYKTVFGDDDSYNLTINGNNFIADHLIELSAGNRFFIKLDVSSDMLNKTTQIFINHQADKNTNNFEILLSNITFLSTGSYYIEVVSDYNNQPMDVYINLPHNSYSIVALYIPTGKTISQVADTLLGYTTKLLDINISIWRLAYYIMVFIIITSVVFMLVYIGWKLFDWASYSPEIKDLWRKKDRNRRQ